MQLNPLPKLDPLARGAIEAVGIVAWLSASLTVFTVLAPYPSAELLRDIVNLGVVLVLAYVVEATWLARRMVIAPDYRNRLGFITAIGVMGLIGVALGILLTAHLAAGHASWLDDLGLAWCLGSLSVLGGLVVTQPLLVDGWENRRSD